MLSSFGRKSILNATNTLIILCNKNVGCIGSGIVTANIDYFSKRRFIWNNSDVTDCFPKSTLRITQPEQAKINHFSSIRKLKISRILSPLNNAIPLAANYVTVSKRDHEEFASVFPDIEREIIEVAKHYGCEDLAKWFGKCLQYNMSSSKFNLGLTTVLAFKSVANPDIITPENLKLARYLGWCFEMFGATLLIIDDIVDGSETRHKRPCWYKLDNVKMAAINDATLVESCIYMILKKFFSHTNYYVKLIELFHEIKFISGTGEFLDLQSANISVDTFTMERFETIALNKSGFFIFYLPVAIAMHMAGRSDPEEFCQLKPGTLELAKFFQIQNDFLDCFGDPKKTGKLASDIQSGKCTWLSVVCMQRANEAQKNIMRGNYGQNDPQKVALIKKLYQELELPKAYDMYEQEAFIPDVRSNKISKVYHDTFDHLWKKSHLFM